MTKRRLAMERLLKVAESDTEGPTRAVRAGAVRTMGLALMESERAERVVEVDPETIDPSFVRDRLDQAGAAHIDELAASIETGGQLVPILLRPHPDNPDRYQIAYGHRRWQACRRLGRPVRAIVRSLDDEALVLAQGRENNERRDLTFIERAEFAAALTSLGMTRTVVGQALNIDKTELARLLAVAHGLPEGLAAKIGRAPKAGRPRWLKLVGLIKAHGERAAFEALEAAAEGMPGGDSGSDARFKALLLALEALSAPRETPKEPDPRAGRPVVITHGSGTTRITINERAAPGFAAFLEERIAMLLAEYGNRPPPAANPTKIRAL
ncbi:MAG: plasmid partitioning protein RepB [Pseudomonadota bacterium]